MDREYSLRRLRETLVRGLEEVESARHFALGFHMKPDASFLRAGVERV